MTFGQKLREERMKQHKTLAQVAYCCNISTTSLSLIERGLRLPPDIVKVIYIMRYLGFDEREDQSLYFLAKKERKVSEHIRYMLNKKPLLKSLIEIAYNLEDKQIEELVGDAGFLLDNKNCTTIYLKDINESGYSNEEHEKRYES